MPIPRATGTSPPKVRGRPGSLYRRPYMIVRIDWDARDGAVPCESSSAVAGSLEELAALLGVLPPKEERGGYQASAKAVFT